MANDYLDIDVDDLREFVRDRGEAIEWEKASLCPCSQAEDVGEESAAPESCSYGCVGGQIYTLRVLPDEIKASAAIVTDYNKGVWMPDLGRVPSGTAKWIGMADELLLGDQDIITLLDREDLTREVIRRRAGDFDTLAHYKVSEVLEVRLGTRVFESGTEYALVSGTPSSPAKLHWLLPAPARPGAGQFYSLEYLRHPRLINLLDSNRPARRNMAGQKLVQRLTLTILPLVAGEAPAGGQ